MFEVNVVLLKSLAAGLLAALACGLGVLPLLVKRLDPGRHTGIGYALAGGLMFAASVYNLIIPGMNMTTAQVTLRAVAPVLFGILSGSAFLWLVNQYLSEERMKEKEWSRLGSRAELLIFFAMMVHSIPEGIAVGVGYTSGELNDSNLGSYIALAIAIHNIPEGLAIAIPMRSAGASINKCFWAAVLTSLPQPIAAIPACLLAWFFQPLMPFLMGFAAGAMIFLVLLELIPHALGMEKPTVIAWSFILGFCSMILIQVIL